MILYHFTARSLLPSILDVGLTKGEVPLDDRRTLNAVNLTTNPKPFGHGLDDGTTMIDGLASAKIAIATGQYIPPGTKMMNKQAVRISIKISSRDRNLRQWLPWARKNLELAYLNRLVEASGGGVKSAKTWWVYFGVIEPSLFVGVDVLDPTGD